MLLGNDLHYKAIKNNIRKQILPNIILLYGEYGTGKTHFSKEIARLILCPDHCRTCYICKGDISEDTFNKNASLTNMAKVNHEQARQLLKENVDIYSESDRVFIYDEFHLLPKKDQSLWLAETTKLDKTFLILTTTSLSQIDNGIKSRALKIKMNRLSLKQIKDLLSYHDLTVTDNIVKQVYDMSKGIPRDILICASYIKNSGLDDEESSFLITNQSKPPIDILLQIRDIPDDFLKMLRDIDNNFTKDEIITTSRDILWDELLRQNEKNYKNILINSLMQLDKNYLAALMNCMLPAKIQKKDKEVVVTDAPKFKPEVMVEPW